MFRKLIKVFFFIVLILIIVQPIRTTAIKPVVEITTCFSTTRFDPGENLTINLYFSSVGHVVEDHLIFYVNDDIYIEKLIYFGEEKTENLNDQATNAQRISGILPNLEKIENYDFNQIAPLWAVDEETKLPPFQITLATRENVRSGEHDLKVVYLYKDENETWYKTTDTMTFHITTEAEQIEYETLKLSLTEPYLAALLAFLSGLGLYFLGLFISKIIKKRQDKEAHKKLLRFIKQEIESNRTKANNLQHVSPNALPQNRMEVSNKDAVWPKIIEYPKRNFDLTNRISNLYDKYGLLNRTIDSGFTFAAEGKGIPKGLNTEIQRICKVIDKNSEKIIDIIKTKNVP